MQINALAMPRVFNQPLTFNLPEKKLTVVIGQNGAGKSTLLNALARRLPEAAYLPQKNQIYDDIRVKELLALGQQRAKNAPTVDIFAALAIEPLLSQRMATLSGGQQQRVWLAFVLCQQTPVVLLDEPLTGLDLRYQSRLAGLLRSLNVSVVMVVHDLNYAQREADWIWVVHDQQLMAGTPGDMLQESFLSEVFNTPIRQHITTEGMRYFDV